MSNPKSVVLSRDHASSYGVPVLLLDGEPEAYGPADWHPTYGPVRDVVLLWSREPGRTARERADAELFLGRERAVLDDDHEARPYDPLLRAGFCLVCQSPIRIDDRGDWTHAPGNPETPRRPRVRRERHDLHGRGAVLCEVYDLAPAVDYWSAVTDVPCPVAGCDGRVIWFEAGYVPGYRVCVRDELVRHHFLAAGTAAAPTLIRDREGERAAGRR